MTEGIATEVMGCESVATLWKALENLYGAHSKSKMDETRTLIQTTRKGSTSMEEYLKQKKSWSDSLALAGEPYPENQFILNVTSGLDIEYLQVEEGRAYHPPNRGSSVDYLARTAGNPSRLRQ